MINIHIGFDDTDSTRKGCTTYIAALLVEKLSKKNVVFIDYPNLVRLNPNVPWKTRGNGALCLRIRCEEELIEEVIDESLRILKEKSDVEHPRTDPAIIFFSSEHIPQDLKIFSKKTIQSVVKIDEAKKLIKKYKMRAYSLKKGRGLIGALAAIGETLTEDYTYEVIAYRKPENYGKPRQINISSIIEMNEKTFPLTFNNIDPETKRVLITPRGPDPILYGIRGETAEIVKEAHSMIRPLEPIERWVIFRTNQGTDAHLKKIESIKEVRPFHPVIVTGTVASAPRIIPRRHVIFSIMDETGRVDCAAYEPTDALRKIARYLLVGDRVEVYGGVRPLSSKNPVTINLEKIKILELAPDVLFLNPSCPQCGKRMKSMGEKKGFRCHRCGFKSSKMMKIIVEKERKIHEGLYITSPHSQRHLTKPLSRYGREKTEFVRISMINRWHEP
jgi:tRNA(Ile2)-agmatinylcytidine synthase